MASTTMSNTKVEFVINGHHGHVTHVKAVKGILVNGVHGVHVQQHVAMESVRATGTVMEQQIVRNQDHWNKRKTVQTYQDVWVHGLNGVHALRIVKIAVVDQDPENVRENASDQIDAMNTETKKKNAKSVQLLKMRVSNCL